MNEWDPDDIAAHLAFQDEVSRMLEESGEFVDAQALTPESVWVRYGGPGAAPVTTDGPYPETSDLVAGWYLVDVDSYERALEIAGARVVRAWPWAASRSTSGSRFAR